MRWLPLSRLIPSAPKPPDSGKEEEEGGERLAGRRVCPEEEVPPRLT